MSFKQWFTMNAMEMANNYSKRIDSLEKEVKMLKGIIMNMYVDTDVNVMSRFHNDPPDVDVTVKLKVSTNSYDYDVDEIYDYCTPCETCGSLLLVGHEHEVCEICERSAESDDNNDSIDIVDDYE